MSISFQDGDNFRRNLATICCVGAPGGRYELPIEKILTVDALPVPIEEIAEDLRVDDPGDDAGKLRRAAQGAGDLLEKITAYAFLPGLYRVLMPSFWTGGMTLHRGPYRAGTALVEAMTGRDAWTAVPTDQTYATAADRAFTLHILSTFSAPALWTEVPQVRLSFEAGFDSDAESGFMPIPPGLRQLFIATTGHFYQNIELGEAEAVARATREPGLASAINAYRWFW